jgi:hypothetical protein
MGESMRLGNLALVAMLAGILSCNANPYKNVPGTLGPFEKEPEGGTFTIQAPPTIDIVEGSSSTTAITSTTGGAAATLAISGQPVWATFDSTTGKLKLSPPVGAGSNPSNPTVNEMTYAITVTLATAVSPVVSISQSLVVIVHQQATSMQILDLPTALTVLEGQEYTASLQVTSAQFSNGPFQISGVGLPTGIQIQPTSNPTVYQLSYDPGYSTVTTSNHNANCLNSIGSLCWSLPWTLTVIAPNGTASSVALNWQVQDVRRPPAVVSPSNVPATSDTVSFQVQVSDPNGETIPQVTASTSVQPTPTITTIQSSTGSSTASPSMMVTVSWKPTTAPTAGSSQTINLNSCVLNVQGTYQNCVTTPVTVQF